jgi:hypothetical protein
MAHLMGLRQEFAAASPASVAAGATRPAAQQTQSAAAVVPAAQPATQQSLPDAVAPPAEDFVVIQNKDGETIAIANYKGSARSIIIPKELYGRPVTDIKKNAFKNKELTGVVISEGITTIENDAFRDNRLTGVVIPNSVTTIGDIAFSGNLLTSVTIPNSVTSIGNNAFSGNLLTSVVISNSVITIGDYAFSRNRLTDVVIPNSVTTIGDIAFSNNLLTSVTIPNSVTSIGNNAFSGNLLTSVTIPNSVTSIGNEAFGNNYLTSVVIPNSVTTIGRSAFRNNQILSVILGRGLTRIESEAFSGNRLASVTIAKDISSINTDAGFDQNFINFYEGKKRAPGTYSKNENGPLWSSAAVTPVVAQTPVPMVGEYAVGAVGPTGGIIFFDKGLYTDGWRYLEAAPVETEFTAGWSDAKEKCGLMNYGNVHDWRLPGKKELNWMYVFLKTKELGGFGDGWYWSSSQDNNTFSAMQRFSDGSQDVRTNSTACSVRAVRAF